MHNTCTSTKYINSYFNLSVQFPLQQQRHPLGPMSLMAVEALIDNWGKLYEKSSQICIEQLLTK